MSIKGSTQELFVGKTEINIMTFMGNKVTILYTGLKRIDYCYATFLKLGYMTFISSDGKVNKFEFGVKANDPVERAVQFISENHFKLELREYTQNEGKGEKSVNIIPVFGHKELGLSSLGFTIRQKSNGDTYFNHNTVTFYGLIGYEWSGPEFSTITKTAGSAKEASKTTKDGKALKIGAGAVLGNLIAPGVGTLVGAAMGAGSKSKSKTIGNTISNSLQSTDNVERSTNATISFRNKENGGIHKISFKCNRDLDAKIRCLTFDDVSIKVENDKPIILTESKLSLAELKTLKELLDIGAITQQEFDDKKKQILNL